MKSLQVDQLALSTAPGKQGVTTTLEETEEATGRKNKFNLLTELDFDVCLFYSNSYSRRQDNK